ncbi:MAG: hypothetical protein JWM87_3034 [Candidatus Eremiobacteraeota bacterium]|nr:hypothetical protein [Candidatus Eremiobacteraeota bacterium]
MRHRASWIFFVAVVSLVIGGLTTAVTWSYPGGTDLAATPCSITAKPITIVTDPRIRFEAKVVYDYGRVPVERAPATRVIFRALPSGKVVGRVRLAGSLRTDFDVPVGTTAIGVQLTTGNRIDATDPRTPDSIGRFRLERTSSVTWLIPRAPKASPERNTQY